MNNKKKVEQRNLYVDVVVEGLCGGSKGRLEVCEIQLPEPEVKDLQTFYH